MTPKPETNSQTRDDSGLYAPTCSAGRVESGATLDDLADNWEREGFPEVAQHLREIIKKTCCPACSGDWWKFNHSAKHVKFTGQCPRCGNLYHWCKDDKSAQKTLNRLRPWEIKAAAADKSIKPEVGETLEYLWDGYQGEGQWRRCTITKIVEGQSWTRLHERMYYGIDHNDRCPREGILHPRAFRRNQKGQRTDET